MNTPHSILISGLIVAAVLIFVIPVVNDVLDSRTPTHAELTSYRKSLDKKNNMTRNGEVSWQNDRGFGLFGTNGSGYAGFTRDMSQPGFNFKPRARELLQQSGMDSSIQTQQEITTPAPGPANDAKWLVVNAAEAVSEQTMVDNAAQRQESQPYVSPYSMYDKPAVASINPSDLQTNPVDPFLDNVLFQLSTFRNRNASFDPRGQAEVPDDFVGHTDQLVPIRNLERLAYHGPSHQITGCTKQFFPRY